MFTKKLMSMQSKHPVRNYLRNALDTFTLRGPNGEHQYLVHEPMLENTQELLRRSPSHRFTEDLLRAFTSSFIYLRLIIYTLMRI